MQEQHHRPPVSEEWDEYAGEWLSRGRQQVWREHSDSVNAALISEWLPQELLKIVLKTDLFDEAATLGLTPLLQRRSRAVIGMDVSRRILGAAANKHRSLVCVGADVRALPFADRSIDVVVSISTLDHFRSAAEIRLSAGELHRVLVPGGTLILTLDNPLNPVVAIRNALPFALLHRAGLVPYPVGATMGPAAARRMLVEAGFSVTHRTAVMHAPRLLAVALLSVLGNPRSGTLGSVLSRGMSSFERLRRLPTRYFTGHFVALRAVKPE